MDIKAQITLQLIDYIKLISYLELFSTHSCLPDNMQQDILRLKDEIEKTKTYVYQK